MPGRCRAAQQQRQPALANPVCSQMVSGTNQVTRLPHLRLVEQRERLLGGLAQAQAVQGALCRRQQLASVRLIVGRLGRGGPGRAAAQSKPAFHGRGCVLPGGRPMPWRAGSDSGLHRRRRRQGFSAGSSWAAGHRQLPRSSRCQTAGWAVKRRPSGSKVVVVCSPGKLTALPEACGAISRCCGTPGSLEGHAGGRWALRLPVALRLSSPQLRMTVNKRTSEQSLFGDGQLSGAGRLQEQAAARPPKHTQRHFPPAASIRLLHASISVCGDVADNTDRGYKPPTKTAAGVHRRASSTKRTQERKGQ